MNTKRSANEPAYDHDHEDSYYVYDETNSEKMVRRIFDQLVIEMRPVKYRDEDWSKKPNAFAKLNSLREVLK